MEGRDAEHALTPLFFAKFSLDIISVDIPSTRLGQMYHPAFAPGVAPYAVASNPPYAFASNSPYAVASNPGFPPIDPRGPPPQGMTMAPAPFPYQQALASYNNVTPNHQGRIERLSYRGSEWGSDVCCDSERWSDVCCVDKRWSDVGCDSERQQRQSSRGRR